jgi:hypothetical protein
MFMDAKFSSRARSAVAGAAALSFLAMANPAAAATLIQYDFTGNSGNETTVASSFAAGNLAGVSFSRGAGLSATSGTNAFSAASWGNYATSPIDYLAFGLTVASGYTASVNQLVFSSRSSGTGPGALAVLASIDGGAFSQIARFTQADGVVGNQLLNFTALTGTSSLLFRIVSTGDVAANGGAVAGGGTFRVQNYAGTPAGPFSINGTVSAVTPAVPEPASWALMIVGVGLVGGAMRRRSVRVRYAV